MSDTLRIHEIEGHGYYFEASTGAPEYRYLGTFERIEVYRHKAWVDATDSDDEAREVPAGLVIEAGDEYRVKAR